MSNNNKDGKNNIAESIALLASTGGGNSSAQDRLASLLERRFAEEEKEKREKEEQFKALRDAQIAEVRRTMAERAAVQEQCPHMKPNFRPAIGGQKDSKGNYHFICQYCAKEWHTGDGGVGLPVHLRIPGEQVGGPI